MELIDLGGTFQLVFKGGSTYLCVPAPPLPAAPPSCVPTVPPPPCVHCVCVRIRASDNHAANDWVEAIRARVEYYQTHKYKCGAAARWSSVRRHPEHVLCAVCCVQGGGARTEGQGGRGGLG